jgi:hypothetical protein
MEDKIFIDGEEYRYVELRHRGKYIGKDGKAVNPYHKKQKCTIHYNSDGYPCFGGGGSSSFICCICLGRWIF